MAAGFLEDRPPLSRDPRRVRIREAHRADETACVAELLELAAVDGPTRRRIRARARSFAARVRRAGGDQLGVEAFLREYRLSTREGVMLMCLAEALLRIPDPETADRLIRDKLARRRLVAASRAERLAAGQRLDLGPDADRSLRAHRPRAATPTPGAWLNRLVHRLGEPVLRQALLQAMRVLGRHFVLGQTIEQAIGRAREAERKGYRYSYDMLGEAARTGADAEHYHGAYADAIAAIVRCRPRRRPDGPAGHLDQAVGAPSPLRARPAPPPGCRAVSPCPRAPPACPRRRHRGDHRCRGSRAPGAVARPVRAPRRRAGTGRLGRPRPRGAGLSEARDPRDRLAGGSRRAPAAAASRCAWSRALTGTPRSSGPRSRASTAIRCSRASSPPTSPISPARGACSPAARRSIRSSRRTTPRRWPASSSSPATGATSSSSACTAWARRCTRGWSAPTTAGDRVPGLCAGRQPPGPAALSGPPSARERRQHLVRQSHSGRERAAREPDRGPGGPVGAPEAQAASRDSARRPTSTGPTGATPGASICAIPPCSTDLARAARCRVRAGLRGATGRRGRARRGPGGDRPGRSLSRRGQRDRGRRRGDRRGGGSGPGGLPRLGPHASSSERADCLTRAADLYEANARRAPCLVRARGGQDPARCGRRGARGGGFPALLRQGGARRGRTAGAAGADRREQPPEHSRPRRVRRDQPLELPARDLHRADRGGAGGRQCGARQAGAANPADRRQGGSPAASRRACPRMP